MHILSDETQYGARQLSVDGYNFSISIDIFVGYIMAKSDIEDTLESPGNFNDSTMIPDANNKLLGENHTIIYSCHFMVSCIDDEDNELAKL